MLAGTVRRQLWSDDPATKPASPVPVMWIGGVFASDTLLQRFRMLVELEGSVSARPPLHGPAVGALLIACKLAGLTIKPDGASAPTTP
jgi:hypothetical protein